MIEVYRPRGARIQKIAGTCLVVFLLAALGVSPAYAWWNDEWTARKELTVDASITGADINETLVDFPILVRLHTGNFGFFLDLAEQGKDIRFIGGDKLPLQFHIEKIDVINEMSFIWVKIPQISGGSNSEPIWMYYGNPEAVAGDNAGGTYGVNLVGVYHFGDPLSADSTAYANHAAEATAVLEPGGFIGSAARFRSADRIVLNSSVSLTLDSKTGWSFSTWVKPEATDGESVILRTGDAVASIELVIQGDAILLRANTSRGVIETTPQPIRLNTWEHLSANFNGSQLALFVGGEEVAKTDAALPAISALIVLGAGIENRYFTGLLDEVEISNVSRTPDWIRALARSQGIDSTVLSFGGDESNESDQSASYFGIILSNLTIDGWVIIGLLAVMFFISMMVMVSKSVIISRTRKDNRLFMTQFRQLGHRNPAALDIGEDESDAEIEDSAVLLALFGKHDNYQSSSLYPIYHAGIQEIKHRKIDALRGLSPEALAVIRVHLEAALSREFQRLNKQLVLLTIAISGGPFLGLLGTVMGVMITFAAIAATGDVNINAIAPGISAALMATVAGLAVAIPCLFGYNYLLTQIKELNVEMRIFADELIHRIAESSKL
ncbi:MAG: DUF2341 domain-containing protein [Methylococcales bacterium]